MKILQLLLLFVVAMVVALLRPVADVLNRLHWSYARRVGFILETAHSTVESFTDTTYAICATLPATYDSAGYGATSLTYTSIGKVSDFLAYGSKRDVNKFQPISGGVEKTKGAPDYGDGDMVMGDVPADAGQVILKAAEASSNHYSIKITYPDGEVHYLDVLVSKWELSGGKEGNPLLRTATVNLCRAPVIVAAS